MNLIFEPWIPVRRADGKQHLIPPWKLTDGIDNNPILAIASPRPDFDGSLTQFLIGLLQTTCTPDVFTSRKWQTKPPAPEELKLHFEEVAHAFELEGEKAFMQDFTPSQLDKTFPISGLLIGSPPEDSETDLFIKQGKVMALCPHCVAAALFSIQTDSPEGGRGYRTGLRGGGPLTTLLLGDNLWQTCWMNVLEESRYWDGVQPERKADRDRFPWLAPTRTSEAKPPAGVTRPGDVHPDQQYWTLPRRIRLQADACESVICDICGRTAQQVYRTFKARNYGVNYEGFEHPLSPHYIKDNARLPVHPHPGGIGYRHWLGLVESGQGSIPARVVQQNKNRRMRRDGSLWAFGYDMKSNKARCWYDARMPILYLPEEIDGLFQELVGRLVNAAEKIAAALRVFLKSALFGEAKIRGDLSYAQAEFWEASESAFYVHIRRLREVLPRDPNAYPILESWMVILRVTAYAIFDRHSQTGDFDAVDPQQIAKARNALGKSLGGTMLGHKILGLPKPIKSSTQS